MEHKQHYQVLVVEDEPSLQEAIKTKLEKAGVEPFVFDNGQAALDEITKRGKQFDGIWLDFDIYGMNGLEFMQQFITMADWQQCPVVIVSNTGNPELIAKAIELGAKEWIIKAEVRLDDTVNRFIKLIDTAKA
ncbi:MAG TPA: response regulator [Candidatus Saccharimonadia bacterium]|nr:response regulator [Candidatus Saccharimonadia bacterium]